MYTPKSWDSADMQMCWVRSRASRGGVEVPEAEPSARSPGAAPLGQSSAHCGQLDLGRSPDRGRLVGTQQPLVSGWWVAVVLGLGCLGRMFVTSPAVSGCLQLCWVAWVAWYVVSLADDYI